MAEREVLEYCIAEVRQHDRERYLTAVFAPESPRQALFALYAFNLEIARTRETVSEPMLGEIRLQWWRESIEGLFTGTPRQHHVVLALAASLQRSDLFRGHFDALIDARVRDLYDEPFQTLEELEGYAEATSSRLIYLALEALSASDQSSRRAARHIGIAWGLLGLIRAIPHHAPYRRLYVPQDLLAAAQVDGEDVLRARFSPALAGVIEALVTRARHHLGEARALRRALPIGAVSALLPASLADRHVASLRSAGYDPFKADTMLNPLGAPLWLAWRALRGRY